MSEYEHQEPIFRSSTGKTPARKIEQYLAEQKAYDEYIKQQDEIPTERDLTETQDMKDLRTANEIMDDGSMREIFTFLVKDDFTRSIPLGSDDIKKFRQLYPKESDFDAKAGILIDKTVSTNHELHKRHLEAESRLKDLLYPKNNHS